MEAHEPGSKTMKIDIDGLLTAAVFLDREEEDLCQWELEAERISFGLSDADPDELASKCKALSVLQTNARTLAHVSSSVRQDIHVRHEQEAHPDVRPAVDRQTAKAQQLKLRMIYLRRHMLDLAAELAHIIGSLQEERLEDSLFRLFGNTGEPLTTRDMELSLETDRTEIRGAMTALMKMKEDQTQTNGKTAFARNDLIQALTHLESLGLALRQTRPLRSTKWTVKQRPRPKVTAEALAQNNNVDPTETSRLLNAA